MSDNGQLLPTKTTVLHTQLTVRVAVLSIVNLMKLYGDQSL